MVNTFNFENVNVDGMKNVVLAVNEKKFKILKGFQFWKSPVWLAKCQSTVLKSSGVVKQCFVHLAPFFWLFKCQQFICQLLIA